MTIDKSVEHQAKLLADFHREGDSSIQKVLWFPNEEEIRLVLINSGIAPDLNDLVLHPIYFRPSESDGLELPSAVALIHPLEVNKVKLPTDWVNWDEAVPL